MTTAPEKLAEKYAQLFHETYERLAPEHGYETRKASAVPWADVPANNKALMTAVVGVVLAELVPAPAAPTEPEGFDPHEAARQVVLSCAEDIDYCGIGEQFGDDWEAEGLTEAEWDARQRHVHDLATSATVTVTWPEETT